MIMITLFIFLMILSILVNAIQIYLGIPEITLLTKNVNSLIFLIISIKYGGIMVAFLVQQYETKRKQRI